MKDPGQTSATGSWILTFALVATHLFKVLNTRFSTLDHEIHFPAEISSNLDQTQLPVTF